MVVVTPKGGVAYAVALADMKEQYIKTLYFWLVA